MAQLVAKVAGRLALRLDVLDHLHIAGGHLVAEEQELGALLDDMVGGRGGHRRAGLLLLLQLQARLLVLGRADDAAAALLDVMLLLLQLHLVLLLLDMAGVQHQHVGGQVVDVVLGRCRAAVRHLVGGAVARHAANFEQLGDANEVGEVLLIDAHLADVHEVENGLENRLLDAHHEENGMRAGVVLRMGIMVISVFVCICQWLRL